MNEEETRRVVAELRRAADETGELGGVRRLSAAHVR